MVNRYFDTAFLGAAILASTIVSAAENTTLALSATASKQPDTTTLLIEPETIPNWSITEIPDDFSDIHTFEFSTVALNDAKCRWGTKPVTLVLECNGGQMTARFQTHCRISTSKFDDYGDVRMRIDGAEDVTVTFSESDDNRSLGLWDNTTATPFVETIVDRTSLVAQIKPYADEPFVARFNITGLKQMLAPYEADCG